MSNPQPSYYANNTQGTAAQVVMGAHEPPPAPADATLALIDVRLRALKLEIALLEKLRRDIAPQSD